MLYSPSMKSVWLSGAALAMVVIVGAWWKPWALPDGYRVGVVEQVGEVVCADGELGGGSWRPCGRDVRVRVGEEQRTVRENDAGSASGEAWFLPVKSGTRVLVYAGEAQEEWQLADVWRLPRVAYVLLLFVALAFLVGGARVLGALMGMLGTAIVVLVWLVPGVLNGWSWGAITLFLMALSGVSILAAHGWSVSSRVAAVSTVGTLGLAGVCGWFFQTFLALTGMGSEEAALLVNATNAPIAPLLLFAGMMLGCLGVLDDVAVAQAALVQELRDAYAHKEKREWFSAAMRVGREHVLSLVNTLVLAYAGTAFVLIAYTSTQAVQWGALLTSEFMLEEILRMAVGSMAVLLAVPFTTAVAVWWPWPHASVFTRGEKRHTHTL